LLTAIVLLACAPPAGAVVNVRMVRWEWVANYPLIRHDTQAPVDTVSRYRVNFDADVGLVDIENHGFRFDIAERDLAPDTDDVLLHITLAPCADLPPLGTEVTFIVEFGIYCDGQNKLHGWAVRYWAATWCSAPAPTNVCSGWFLSTQELAPSEPEKFELVVVDEKGVEAPHPTQEDLLRCLWATASTDAGFVTGAGHALPGSASPTQGLDSGSVGIYADSLGTRCSIHVTPFVPFRLYMLGHLAGLSACGIANGEFGVEGIPPSLYGTWTPSLRVLVQSGSPLTAGVLSYAQCEQGRDGWVLLYTLDAVLVNDVHDAVLRVRGGAPPSNTDFPCPWFGLCDQAEGQPLYTKRCLETVSFILNPSPGNDCTTAVQPRSWGDVKALYR
jgi:hypothetical protein